MDEKKIKNVEETRRLTDKEAEAVNGGMKVFVTEQPSFLRTFLRFIFGVKNRK